MKKKRRLFRDYSHSFYGLETNPDFTGLTPPISIQKWIFTRVHHSLTLRIRHFFFATIPMVDAILDASSILTTLLRHRFSETREIGLYEYQSCISRNCPVYRPANSQIQALNSFEPTSFSSNHIPTRVLVIKLFKNHYRLILQSQNR